MADRPLPEGPAVRRVVEAIADSGLVTPDSGGVVMFSGGPDSTALILGLAHLCRSGPLVALHVDYGFREDSHRDREACRSVCEALGVELVEVDGSAAAGSGNAHDNARRIRYEAARDLCTSRGLEWIAVGHTATDLAETVVYRLAVSPGTRALRPMPATRDGIVRPLLSLSRDLAREATIESGLAFVEDRSNLDPKFARTRIRSEVMPVLRGLNPAVERNIALTREELEQESDLMSGLAATLLVDGAGGPSIGAAELTAAHPALARHAIRMLALASTGREVPVPIATTATILRLADSPEGGSVDLGSGVMARVESGSVTVVSGPRPEPPDPVGFPIPGSTEWGGWKVEAVLVPGPVEPEGPEVATLDAEGLGSAIEVRGWLEGDRIRPLGLGGSRPVSDLMADRGIPRSARSGHPVVVAGGEIAWIPGVAIAERFRIGPVTARSVVLSASPSEDPVDPISAA